MRAEEPKRETRVPGRRRVAPMKRASSNEKQDDLPRRIHELSVKAWGPERAIEIIGRSPGVLGALKKVEKVARYREPVLIMGESGVGKESIAQSIYLLSDRRGKPFVSMNCPQYREGNLTVSELFGHRKGAFTGAIADRKGAFEEADGGVIFLDEIADLHLDAQAMLLRALASGEFSPIGDSEPRRSDLRVVAATNRPLDKLILAEEFRNDLFFRLHYFPLKIPPLRERDDDWQLLLEHVLQRLRAQYGVMKRFSHASMHMLEKYDWPGNVRELIGIATLGYAMADGDLIEPEDFAAQMQVGDERDTGSIESLYRRVAHEDECFWGVVHRPFMDRELNRSQVRSIVKRGLIKAGGTYRQLLTTFGLPDDDYQKFMDFLRHHDLKP